MIVQSEYWGSQSWCWNNIDMPNNTLWSGTSSLSPVSTCNPTLTPWCWDQSSVGIMSSVTALHVVLVSEDGSFWLWLCVWARCHTAEWMWCNSEDEPEHRMIQRSHTVLTAEFEFSLLTHSFLSHHTLLRLFVSPRIMSHIHTLAQRSPTLRPGDTRSWNHQADGGRLTSQKYAQREM